MTDSRQRFHVQLLPAHNPGPMTGRGNNTYLLSGEAGEAMLVDAGVGETRHLESIAQALAASRKALARVIVTHAHPDHIAGAAAVARQYPGAWFGKNPAPDDPAGIAWQPLADGDLTNVGGEAIQVLHTPGHAPDHIALWHAPTRAVWVGDLVIQGSSVAINWSHGGRMAAYLASIQRVMDLVPQTLYPAHGPVITNPARVLSACLAHRLEREAQVVAALQSGRDTVQAIVDSIYDGLDARLARAAHETIRAHLEKLQDERRAQAGGPGGCLWTMSSTSST